MRPNELFQKGDLLAGDLLAPVAPRFRHNRSMPEQKSERKGFVSAYLPPHGRRFSLRVARRQQHLRLVRLQHPRGFVAGRPPLETPFGQSLSCQPKPLAIELEDPDGGSTPAAEDKQVTGKWIGVQFLPA